MAATGGKRALTLGGAVIDTIVTIPSSRIEHMRMTNAETSFLLVEEGRKVDAESITRHVGGGGVNTAVALARLGFATRTVVRLGRDRNGDDIMARLAEEGIDTGFVVTSETEPTGSSVLISSHERNAGIFTARGANTGLKPADLAEAAFAADLVYVSGLSNESADCFPAILAKAEAAGARTAVNPGIRQLSSRAAEFMDCLGRIGILAVNRVEAEQLVPRLVAHGVRQAGARLPAVGQPSSLIDRGLVAGGFEMPFETFAAGLTGLGVGIVLVTNGSDGAYAATAEAIWHCTVPRVEVAGTAGAGDAFAATFAAMVSHGESVPEALKAATCNAGSVVTFVDTQTGLLDRPALKRRVARYAEELSLTRWPLA